MNSLPATINIQPHPRILSVLKDMEFSAVQSIAELCDNAFDDFLQFSQEEPAKAEQLSVRVTLPRGNDDPQAAEVWVVDNGRGMTLEKLNDAMRAGWSGNDPFDQLGLFGLGFNVATARLGRTCRVLTTRAGDDQWYGVEIALLKLRAQATFDVPVISEPKNDPSQHGTKLIVSELNPAIFNDLTRKKAVRDQLGDIYAPLLTDHPFSLIVAGTRVEPRRHCLWDASRVVTFGSGRNAEEIPARLEFEKELKEQGVCADCHRWQDRSHSTCVDCDSPNIHRRQRVIRGWIGVQRYLDGSRYGIDFIRNGRKIISGDKKIFSWLAPDGTVWQEYPVELGHLGGRLVGEVHVDYAKPSWQKDAFENEAELVVVREFLRGDDGPLRPQYRKKYNYPGYAPGPLARIYRAFSEVRPGKRHLIPGNGTKAIHEKAREWGERFHAGDPEYESDAKWWDAVVFHEQVKEERQKIADAGREESPADAITLSLLETGEADESLVRDIFGEIPEAPTEDTSAARDLTEVKEDSESYDLGQQDTPETFLERVDRYLEEGQQIPDLDGEITVPKATRYVSVKAILVSEAVLDQDNQRVPVLVRFDGSTLNVFVDAFHPLFTEYDTEYVDVVIAEIAEVFRVSFESEVPLAEIIWLIKDSKLADRKQKTNELNNEAQTLLATLRDRMATAASDEPEAAKAAWNVMDDAERFSAETAAAGSPGGPLSPGDPEMLRHIPALALPRIVQDNPGAWLDGKVFDIVWAGLSQSNERGRWLAVARVAGLLYDLGMLVERPVPLQGEALRRAALSLPLLDDILSEDAAGNAA